ncbi:hypothetical protein RCL_jg4040.t2 [Rhizophagus clarus]|uniref:Uncharacterized protein n=1 Tax=Rhizophagus clarus TaxID=94130 RepID=A0A8H3KTI0_9GLOM|nr:hypothetical protein RCL_jg4040.t2 [Rhizophagus clarus]
MSDPLVEDVKRFNTEQLINFLQAKNFYLNDTDYGKFVMRRFAVSRCGKSMQCRRCYKNIEVWNHLWRLLRILSVMHERSNISERTNVYDEIIYITRTYSLTLIEYTYFWKMVSDSYIFFFLSLGADIRQIFFFLLQALQDRMSRVSLTKTEARYISKRKNSGGR